MTNLVANLDDSATRRFALLFGLWLAAYAAIVLAWAANNDWPVELWTPLAFVPISLIAAKKLSLRNGFQLAPHDRLSHWELLIAFLLLAVGIAGGLMLLLAVGWLNLGIVCLRPKRLPGDCGEWLKLPLLFACCLPVWTDLSGSRQDWLVYFGVSSSAGPAAMVTFQIASRVALVLLAWWTRGAAFWICLVALPVLVAGLRFVAAPFQFALNDLALDFAVWLVAALLLSGLGLALNRVLDARPNFRASWQRATSRALARPPEPWLAALLILLQQSSLVETWAR
ncbi:MAG: hypothetical protein HY300_13955 [Verrucomicrobia bacterium]|nr:hypothetical protein [Verrucomicrobiota bacterium]